MDETTLIRGGTIITMDANRAIIENGGVVVSRDKIVDVGKLDQMTKQYKPDIVIDARDSAILPGFVNGHSHTWFNLFRNLRDDITIGELIPTYMLPLCEIVKPEEVYIGSQLACVEMIKSGTTTLLDSPPMFVGGKSPVDETGTAIEEMGLRAVFTPGAWPDADIKTVIREYERLMKEWHGKADGKIQIWPSPIEPWPPELVAALSDFARKHKVGITTHLAETSKDVELTQSKYKNRHVELLAEAGALGSNFVGSHAIWLSDNELQLLANTGSKIVYAPGSVMSQGSGVSPVAKMLKLGITVALGSDGAAFNVDMIEEMRLAALIQKGCNMDPRCLSAQKALEMATINGAKALLLDNIIGSIEKGKKADLITVDLKKAHTVPRHDVIQSLVYGGKGSDVDTVLVNGKVVMKDRTVSIDEDQLVTKAENAGLSLVKRLRTDSKSI